MTPTSCCCNRDASLAGVDGCWLMLTLIYTNTHTHTPCTRASHRLAVNTANFRISQDKVASQWNTRRPSFILWITQSKIKWFSMSTTAEKCNHYIPCERQIICIWSNFHCFVQKLHGCILNSQLLQHMPSEISHKQNSRNCRCVRMRAP